ncbi:ABC transporter-like [Macleaya cordata]|uniref:ABC transporter-like n=1 Tax=Macleaya cordata TaxID=56857 RepID=A0A200RAN5_MACCD|nr:ABC transporter-like [Macleaya cordata]
MADFLQQTCLDDDSMILFSTSNSPHESTTPSSSSFHHSPPPSNQSQTTFKLTVRNLSHTIHNRNSIVTSIYRPMQKVKPKIVLKSVSFVARSSEILAVVGPSGAGKSTLLRIISGRIRNKDFNLKSLSLNDHPITSPAQLKRICGFVAQDDNLLPLLTVKETLMFSAKFRLIGMNSKEKEARVESLMQELNLQNVGNSFVGDEETRGISGGERKRVSIGVDVIHDPPILLLDEPTSGLDSRSAFQVIELLSSMAKAKQRTVVLTIHQPSYRILQYISKFLLLSRGSVIHNGSLDLLEETISNLGFRTPAQLNPLEFSMEILKPLEESSTRSYLFEIDEREPSSYSIWRGEEVRQDDHRQRSSCYCWRLFEVMYLCLRFWKIIYRTKQLFMARTMQALVGGLGLGSVFLNVKTDQSGVAERLGLFAFSLSFLLSSTVEALPIYLQERRVLMKETSRGAYRISSYMIANTIVFIPFLLAVSILFAVPVYWLVGLNPSFTAFAFFIFIVWLIVLMASSLVLFLSAVSPDFISGNSLICTVLGAFFLFSGYFIPKDNIPKYWLFMYYVSLYKYPLDSLLINEYWSMKDKCFSWQAKDHSKCLLTGIDVLRTRGLEKDSRWMNVGIMFGFFVFYRILCWIILARRASKTML